MKIAYLIAAHNNYLHLEKLVQSLNKGDCSFYIHIDRKSSLPSLKGRNIIYIEERVNVHWSGFSQVRATISLLKRAVADENDYYAFISGGDYPIKPNNFLYKKLEDGGEFIQVNKMGSDPYAPLSRYKYYYFTDYYNRRNKSSTKTRFFLWLQKSLRKLRIKKSIPFELYTGASWFALSKACVAYVLSEIESNKTYCLFFNTGFCSDESFFQTIIGNSAFYKNVKGNLTYADWSVDPGPAFITQHHLPILKTDADKFFARKFNNESGDIVDLIEKELRG